ncbi:STE24 endopeptidase [Nematocida major]|uniref:STE24 endopeptidase n=1 Tax=Nematocida major TaxID=1912982 RepID=UPI0020089DCD|nr:STE24 endopeptidase [Nematocida major]KAH9387362.1 STE24 endopeptidase [Nematocida major]
MNEAIGESVKSSRSYKAYRLYFNSRLIVFMLSIFVFHVLIVFCEVAYMLYCRSALLRQKLPRMDAYLIKLVNSTKNVDVFRTQAKVAKNWASRRGWGIVSQTFDLIVIVSFFSHDIRTKIMQYTRRFKGIVRINSSHMSVEDSNFLCLALLAMGVKSVLSGWVATSKQDSIDLLLNVFIQMIRCLILCPVIVWLFSSVYNKVKYGLLFAAYVSITVLILVSNCTSLIPESLDTLDTIPAKELGSVLYEELVRLNLQDRIFWIQDAPSENAALVKTGSSRYIIVMGNLIKFGVKEFVSFIAHEVGHADDHSTEKKLLASIVGMGITCGVLVGILHVITPKYARRGVSKFSVLAFLILANMYVFSNVTNMFHNNLCILSEVNADLYAKRLGFGKSLATGLYKLIVENRAPLFHSTIYSYYAQDHPTVSSRIAYLTS